MTGSHSISSTVVPVATLLLGIAIGWRLGPEPAFHSSQSFDQSGRVTLAGSTDGLFVADPESGAPAEIASLPDGVVALGDTVAADSEEDAIQYFPEAVSGEESSPAERPVSLGPPDHQADGRKSVEPFDEDVWRGELTGLTDEQADELVAIRKRLGNVAARTPGVASEAFPSLSGPSSGAGAEGAQPGLLTLPDLGQLRPAIELASGEGTVTNSKAGTSDDASDRTTEDVPGFAGRGGDGDAAAVAGSLSPAIAKFRQAVEDALRLNLRNQKTPGYRRSEVVVVGVEESPGQRGHSVPSDAGQSESRPEVQPSVTGSEVTWLTRLDARHGEAILTGNPLDVAIDDKGWLMVEQGERRCVTRSGLLSILKDGRLGLRTSQGLLPLVPEVRVPSASTGWLNIAGDGSVTIASPSDEGGDQGPVVGRIVPVCFPNESALERLPSGLLVETADSGSAFEAVGAILKQGYLESSTVDPAREQAAAEELLRFADQLESNQ